MPVRASIAAACLSALLLWLASPGVGLGWLAWVAIVPVAVVVLAAPGGIAARLAVPLAYALHLELLLVPAFPFGLADGQWGDPPLPVLVDGSPVLAIALVAVPAFGALLYLLRFGLPWGADRLPGRLATAAAIAIPALAWTALDFARSNLDPGALWGPLFLSQADQPAGSLAALGGPWLATLAIVAVNYAIAAALVERRPQPALVPVAAVLALVVAAAAIERPEGDGPPLRVAAVQPGYDTAEDGRPELRHFSPGTHRLAARDLARDLGELTRTAVGEGAELVVWPEASMYVDPRREAPVRRQLERLVEATGVPIVIPFFRPGSIAAGEVIAFEPARVGAAPTGGRPKHRSLWFLGENRAAGEPGTIEVAGVEVGPLLGTDPQDSRNAAALAADGAALLASATHDWRQSASPARAYGRLAARSSAVPLVRADWRYGSAIYDADGTPVADAGVELRRTALVADVRLATGGSPYAALGDLVGWLALAAVAALGLAGAWRISRAGGRAGGDPAPRRGSPRRRPAPGPPRAAAAPKPPPP